MGGMDFFLCPGLCKQAAHKRFQAEGLNRCVWGSWAPGLGFRCPPGKGVAGAGQGEGRRCGESAGLRAALSQDGGVCTNGCDPSQC